MRNAARVSFLSVLLLVAVPGTATAAPSFAPYATFSTGSGSGPGPAPVGTVAADFDGDGDADIATVNDFGQKDALLLRNTGPAAFGTPQSISGSRGSQSLAAGDVDADGDPDLVGMTASSAIVLRNNGSGSFAVSQTLPLTPGAQIQAILTDTDADGDLDIAAPTFTAVQTLRNSGAGSFSAGPTTAIPGATSLSAIASANLDGSGPRDLLAADGGTGVVNALLGKSDGTLTAGGRLVGAGFGLEDVAAIDLDGDRIDDAATVGSFSFTLGTGLSDGRGGFRSPVASIGSGGLGPTSLGVGDLDRDDRDDLLVSVLATPNPGLHAFMGNGTVRPAHAGLFATGPLPQNPVIRDLDGDGRLDAAVAAPGKLFVLRNTTP